MWKRLVAIVCLLFALFLAVDKTVLYSNLSNNVLRIDIVGENESHDIEISPSVTDMSFKAPSWCKDCLYGRGEFENKSKDVTVKFKVRKKDTVSIWLRGEHLKEENIRIPLFVDYENFVVNNKRVLGRIGTTVWHDAPYKHKMNLKAGDTVEFTVRASKTSIFKTLPYLHFDFLMFVIYFLCTYFVALFIKKYIDSKGFNKIDFCFLAIFGIILFIPMLHISDAEKSEQEKRMLANKPSLMINNKINNKYGAQFDAWFNDRFNGRDTFVDIFSSIKYYTNDIYQNDTALLVKRNGWMFNKQNFYYPRAFDDIVDNFKKFNDFCTRHNMKLYVLLVPDKKIIYSDILDKFNDVSHKMIDDFQRYVSDIQKSVPNNMIVYPYQELLDAKEKDYVFFKQSHHWTDFGAYIGYKSLVQRIRKDFNQFKIVSLDDYDESVSKKIRDDWDRNYNLGHTTRLLNLLNKADNLLDVEYNYYDNKKTKLLTQDVQKYTKTYHNKDKNVRYKVFLTGNSQNEDLLQFLPYSVKSLKYLRLNMAQKSHTEELKFMKYYKQELLNYKPNIVIISVSSVYFENLMKEFYKE